MSQKPKFKLKSVKIEINYRDPFDLKQALLKVIEKFETGGQITEFEHLTAEVKATLNYLEWSNFDEQEINGIWCRVFKSKI